MSLYSMYILLNVNVNFMMGSAFQKWNAVPSWTRHQYLSAALKYASGSPAAPCLKIFYTSWANHILELFIS